MHSIDEEYMSKVTVTCSDCNYQFGRKDNTLKKWGQIGAGAALGVYLGGSTGIALGPYGAINGAGVGAVGVAGAVALGQRSIVKCPNCNKVKLTD